jgi:hypothetical protein
MTFTEIAVIVFACTTAIMGALYWHELSKAARKEQEGEFEAVRRDLWEAVEDLRRDTLRRTDEIERVVADQDERISRCSSSKPR